MTRDGVVWRKVLRAALTGGAGFGLLCVAVFVWWFRRDEQVMKRNVERKMSGLPGEPGWLRPLFEASPDGSAASGG